MTARRTSWVRNPILALPAMRALRSLPDKMRRPLADLLGELAVDARERAEDSWRRHKAPMAAYWKAVSVYAGHIRRALDVGPPVGAGAGRTRPGTPQLEQVK